MEMVEIHQKVFDLLMRHHKTNEQFLFTLRQVNRGGRLDKGYWFLGNDYYLAVSFWKCNDNIRRTPRFAFIIGSDGSTYFEINSRTYSSQPSPIPDSLYQQLGISKRSADKIDRKHYGDFRHNYQESLESFLSGDKVLVDEVIRAITLDDSLSPGYAEEIDFLWPGDFEKQLRVIKKYQQKRKERDKRTGYLRNFIIKKFGQISNVAVSDIPSGCRWIFVTGENGAGKTTVLKALAAALSNNADHGKRVAESDKDFMVTIGLDTQDGIQSHHVNGKDEIEGKKILPKGLAAYGPVRLLTQGSLTGSMLKWDEDHISHQTTYGLFNPIGILRDISGSYVLGVRPKYYEMTLADFLENIELNLQEIMPKVRKVKIIEEGEGHRILYYQGSNNSEPDQTPTPFEHLSSGTRNFAALILDLLLRFAEQQEGASDISDYVGIVLIDEIDLHLHPKMQKEIVIQLSTTFPNIQFIVTTHSPIPLLGAPENSVFINVHRDDSEKICLSKLDIDITNLLPNSLLTSPIFGFDELINTHHDPEERLITEDDYSDAMFYKILERKIREQTANASLNNDTSAT